MRCKNCQNNRFFISRGKATCRNCGNIIILDTENSPNKKRFKERVRRF